MNKPPLQLEFHYYEEVHTKLSEDFIPTSEPIKYETGIWSTIFANPEDPLKYVLRMKISIPHPPNDAIPITAQFGVVGVFQLDESIPIEKRASLVKITGASMLYSASREFIFMVTFRTSPFPPFYLRTLSGDALANAPEIDGTGTTTSLRVPSIEIPKEIKKKIKEDSMKKKSGKDPTNGN